MFLVTQAFTQVLSNKEIITVRCLLFHSTNHQITLDRLSQFQISHTRQNKFEFCQFAKKKQKNCYGAVRECKFPNDNRFDKHQKKGKSLYSLKRLHKRTLKIGETLVTCLSF